ncbi:MAG: hypothetical protein HKN13_13420, partial [Rhodothermales bacterium]|nr:hypothetical protein [Rhodothermales bacterium]
MNRKLIALTLILSSMFVVPAWAVPAVADFTGGGGPFSSFYGTLAPSGDVVGYSFIADIDLTVTDLGVYSDIGADGVLDSSHMVGLWDAATQGLLGSALVDNTGALIGEFYFATLGASISLTAGMEYVL